MNIFSVLDISDNEEEVKQKPVAKKAKETKPEAPKETKTAPAPKQQKEGKPKQPKQQTPAAPAPVGVDPVEVVKENTKGRNNGKTEKNGLKDHSKTGESKRSSKREFDRRSSNPKAQTRDLNGKFVKDEPINEKFSETAVVETAPVEEEKDAEVSVPEVVETTLSYEEFLRKREEARAASSLLAPAKATRVVDVAAQFAGLKTVEEGEDTYIAPRVSKTANVKKDQRSSGKSQIVDVSFKFESATNDFRRRDDNRGARGDSRKPRPAGNKPKAPAQVIDINEFPSL